MERTALYRTIWRWHFYAGLFVIPFILILSVSGAIYLFKPQIDRWEERDFRGLGTAGAVSPDDQLDAALAAYPGARFHAYRLPEAPGDAAMIHLARGDDAGMVDVFVSPQGRVLGSVDPETRIAPTIARFHGSLFLGRLGDWLVELAASWTIVLILTGLYLWWPQGRAVAGVLWPRLHLGGRAVGHLREAGAPRAEHLGVDDQQAGVVVHQRRDVRGGDVERRLFPALVRDDGAKALHLDHAPQAGVGHRASAGTAGHHGEDHGGARSHGCRVCPPRGCETNSKDR